MMTLRPAATRGHADHGWLDTWHSFSFAHFHDPAWMGWRNLRVLNEDRVAPGRGFGLHPHRDMEIVTWVLAGALRHEDSLGHGALILPGEAQRMSAGTGILHSEANPSPTEALHLLQIWLLPSRRGLNPGYEQAALSPPDGGWRLVAAPPGEGGAVAIHAEARLWAADPAPGAGLDLELRPGRAAWVQVARGRLRLNGVELEAGDGAGLLEEGHLRLEGRERDTQALVFELA